MLKKGLKTKMELKEISVILIIILLSVILLFIDFSYPLTLTYDSAHYLWLSSIIKNRNWMDWDPVRNIGFPFFLFIGMELFGSGQLAFAIPMYVLHVLLFIFSSLIIINNERLNNKELGFKYQVQP